MSPEIVSALNRITSLTSIVRVRAGDDARAQVHGGSVEELAMRSRVLAARLAAIADELEKAIA